MKLKFMPMLVGAIAIALATTDIAVKAEPASPSRILLAQADQPHGFDRLGLSQEQKAKVAQIRQNTRSQIEAVLTPQQREQLKTAMQDSRQNKRQVFSTLNLTPEQRTQMRQIRQSAKSQFEAVLTPEQRQQMQESRQTWRQYSRQQPNQ
jgi:periplasmic protein CpxP/Spy